MSAPRVVVHIDRLALHGFDPQERASIVRSLREQLTARFSATAHEIGASGDRDVRALRAIPDASALGHDAFGNGVADSVMRWIRS
jgi:hypothetical protein